MAERSARKPEIHKQNPATTKGLPPQIPAIPFAQLDLSVAGPVNRGEHVFEDIGSGETVSGNKQKNSRSYTEGANDLDALSFPKPRRPLARRTAAGKKSAVQVMSLMDSQNSNSSATKHSVGRKTTVMKAFNSSPWQPNLRMYPNTPNSSKKDVVAKKIANSPLPQFPVIIEPQRNQTDPTVSEIKRVIENDLLAALGQFPASFNVDPLAQRSNAKASALSGTLTRLKRSTSSLTESVKLVMEKDHPPAANDEQTHFLSMSQLEERQHQVLREVAGSIQSTLNASCRDVAERSMEAFNENMRARDGLFRQKFDSFNERLANMRNSTKTVRRTFQDAVEKRLKHQCSVLEDGVEFHRRTVLKMDKEHTKSKASASASLTAIQEDVLRNFIGACNQTITDKADLMNQRISDMKAHIQAISSTIDAKKLLVIDSARSMHDQLVTNANQWLSSVIAGLPGTLVSSFQELGKVLQRIGNKLAVCSQQYHDMESESLSLMSSIQKEGQLLKNTCDECRIRKSNCLVVHAEIQQVNKDTRAAVKELESETRRSTNIAQKITTTKREILEIQNETDTVTRELQITLESKYQLDASFGETYKEIHALTDTLGWNFALFEMWCGEHQTLEARIKRVDVDDKDKERARQRQRTLHGILAKEYNEAKHKNEHLHELVLRLKREIISKRRDVELAKGTRRFDPTTAFGKKQK